MRPLSRRGFLRTTIALAGGSLVSAAPSVRKPAGYNKNVFNFGALQELNTFDPALSTSIGDNMIRENVYETLVRIEYRTGRVIPGLAESWSMSPDNKTYTFKLRTGVKFHDGTSFNAEAVKFNFQRMVALKGWPTEVTDHIQDISVVDESTITFRLKRVFGPWVSLLVINPKFISPTAVKKNEKAGDWGQSWAAENEVGTGPYTSKRWDRGRDMWWVKFDDYWGGWRGDHVTEIHNLIILEASTQRLMVEKGDLDVAMNYTMDSLPALRANPDLVVQGNDLPNQIYLRLNCVAGPLKDVRVRKALAYAWDFKTYQKLLGYDAKRSDGPVPLVLFGEGYKLPEIPYNEYNLDKAKQHLADAGYAKGFEMLVLHDPGVPQKQLIAELFQAQCAKIGVKLNVVVEPFANILARGADKEAQRDWSKAMGGYILYTNPWYPDPSAFLLRMYMPNPPGVRNILQYENQEVTRLIQQALVETDTKKANELYWKANLLIIEDAPDIFLDTAREFVVMRKWVRGRVPHSLWPWAWRYYDISKE